MKSARLYPSHPRAGVGVLVFRDTKVLMVQRAQEPQKGVWTIPGGLVELGETLEQTAHREIQEECGIKITGLKYLDFFQLIERDETDQIKYHYVIIDFLAQYLRGTLRTGSDISDTCWLEVEAALQIPATEATRSLIIRALDVRKTIPPVKSI